MNLVGHVAVAARATSGATPGYLAGAMLPDLGAIARIRLVPTSIADPPESNAARDLAAGVALHHASDAAFHASRWFHDHDRSLRDVLLDAGVDRGAARACAHAGLEMMLDGELMGDPEVARSTEAAFAVLANPGPTRAAAEASVAPAQRARWAEGLDRIRSLDPGAYASTTGIATRLLRITRGRARIELRIEHVELVAEALESYRPVVVRDGTAVVDDVLTAVLGST